MDQIEQLAKEMRTQVDAVKGIAGHGDQQVKIYFELSTSKASGYHVAAFYPWDPPLFHAGFRAFFFP